jgi:hypothetical protein
MGCLKLHKLDNKPADHEDNRSVRRSNQENYIYVHLIELRFGSDILAIRTCQVTVLLLTLFLLHKE